MDTLPLLITMGCPVGIGPELIINYFTQPEQLERPPVVVGDKGVLQGAAKDMGVSVPVVEWTPGDRVQLQTIPVHSISQLDYEKLTWGSPDKDTGTAMGQYIVNAVRLLQEGKGAGMVTCPISKASLNLAGFNFPGHTEMLGSLTGESRFKMMMAGTKLKVVLVTIHEAMEDVPGLLNQERVTECIEAAVAALERDFGLEQPRVAVAGLNPHCGEGGMFGHQEDTIIRPAIHAFQGTAEVVGPLPPDTLFYQAANGAYDAVIAMYHDQGLIPFKLLHFEDGVNVTLGLPIVRTSVDHGTAYDIAGTWQASDASLRAAITMADTIVSNRNRADRP